jgi:hypothetical protein
MFGVVIAIVFVSYTPHLSIQPTFFYIHLGLHVTYQLIPAVFSIKIQDAVLINSLKTYINLHYTLINSVPTSQRTNCTSTTMTNS